MFVDNDKLRVFIMEPDAWIVTVKYYDNTFYVNCAEFVIYTRKRAENSFLSFNYKLRKGVLKLHKGSIQVDPVK